MPDPFHPIIHSLSTAKKVLITTHVRPDGDALGSTAALGQALKYHNIESEILLLSHLPSKYAFIYNDCNVRYHNAEKGWPTDLDLNKFDRFLVCDTGTWSQLPGLKDKVLAWRVPKLVIDHHLTQEDWATEKLVDTTAAAAGEIVAELLERWGVPMNECLATALFVAITTDTGWFQFSNTKPRTMRLAAKLMEVGVDTDRIYQLLYQNERIERLRLQSLAQQSMQLLCDGRLSVITISKSDFQKTNAHVNDTENLINIPLQVRSIEVSLLFTEPPEGGPIRVSLRSKGGIDVARFAEQFQGGGHARAAGLKLMGNLEEVRDKVVSAMQKSLGA